MRKILIDNQSRPLSQPIVTDYCSTFNSRFLGLMFRKSLAQYQGLLLVQPREDRIDSSIHMFFMNFDLAVIWINKQLRVVDIQTARRWRPFYQPARPACYVLETHCDHFSAFDIGHQVIFKDL